MKKTYVAPQMEVIEMQEESAILNASGIPVNPDHQVTPSSNRKDMWGNEGIWN